MLTRTHSSQSPERIVAFLDLGSAKITCMIVALAPWAGRDHDIGRPVPARMMGFASLRSQGVKAGQISNLAQAEAAIRAVVARAEEAANTRIEEVIVGVSCGRLKSANFRASTRVAGRAVRDADIEKVLLEGRAFSERDGRHLVHMSTLGYAVDQSAGVLDPRGMAGERLTAEIHAVTADDAPIRNLVCAIERCYLRVAGVVPLPYASGLSVVSEEEARLGVTCIDFGGGTTTIGIFAERQFVFCDAIAAGGFNLTLDLARQISAPLYEAERIKTVSGTLVAAASHVREPVLYRGLETEQSAPSSRTDKARVGEILRPRMNELLRLVEARIEASGFQALSGERVVLTGGGSELMGLGAYAAERLGKRVRVGRPRPFGQMPDTMTGPGYAGVTGLLQATVMPGLAASVRDGRQGTSSYLGRVGLWFKESFWDDEYQLADRA